jgi:HlyD family secretion protein
MNEISTQNLAPRAAPVLLPRIRSALFEVATQDASPSRRYTLWSILALFVLLLAWAFIARLDIVSVAQGKLVPQTYVKIVQPSDAGIIREILVKDGDAVIRDQVLIRLDPTESAADSSANAQQLALERLQVRRLEAELAGAPLAKRAEDDALLFTRIDAQHRSHKRAVDDSLGQAAAALDRVRKELTSGVEQLRKLEKTAPLVRSAADSYQKLANDNLVGRLEAEDRQRLATEREQDLEAQRATVESLRAAVVEAERSLAQVRSSSRSDLQVALVEASGRVAQLEQTDVKLGFRSRNLELRAPQAGIVKDLATTTVGAVVQPGTVLLNLVPVGEPLRAEVSINNEDIGFVHAGQPVRLKLATFPFQRYGMLEGELESISPDTAPPAATRESGDGTPQAPPGYKGVIRLTEQTLSGGMGRFPVSAGMQLTAEIIEGDRTVMQYLLSPVQRVSNEAGRER